MMALIEDMDGGTYPTYFGVSCAFVALHLLSRMRRLDIEQGRRLLVGELMLRGSCQLLGLLVDRAQGRLKKAELEVGELKARRAEDAKANEKVVGIFATREQSWLAERKRLGLQIQALMNELRAVRTKNEEKVLELTKRIEEDQCVIRCKDEALDDEGKKRKEVEEKLLMAQEVAEELREKANKEAQDRSAELWKHKTALEEMVSNQRQLEAEMGRALRQAEALKSETEEVRAGEEKAAVAVENLSDELAKQRKDSEQKDKILSAMLRKSKLDTAEKQMLLNELKMAKARRKQVELEAESWKSAREHRHKKGSRSLRAEPGCSQEPSAELQLSNSGYNYPKTLLLEYLGAESRREHEFKRNSFDPYSSEGNDELEAPIDDIKQLKDWVRTETEKYAMILEEKHLTEIEAFTEQMRLKDEKLEVLSWQLLSMELELKQLQSHIEGLDGNLSQLRDENIQLEALLIDRERELKSLKEQYSFHLQNCQKSSSPANLQALWSEVKIIKRTPGDKEEKNNAKLVIDSHETDIENVIGAAKILQLKSHDFEEHKFRENTVSNITTPSTTHETSPANDCEEHAIVCINEQSQDLKEEIEEEKEVSIDPVHVQMQSYFRVHTDATGKLTSPRQSFVMKDSIWKVDLHALGVSYKIKRLQQQLHVLEKLVGAQEMKLQDMNSSDTRKSGRTSKQIKGFLMLVSFLKKQVQRYQSLEEKTDDLCRRMHENSRMGSSRDSQGGKTKEQMQVLQGFLEETFQLQRFMVATGQKLMEVQSRIAASFVSGHGLDKSAGFNMAQFADVVRTLFREIQRGLEVRIARIIGDLEGTLACDGILR